MISKKRLMAVLATGLLSVGAGAFTATTPAQAALGNCPGTTFKAFCLYTGANQTGTVETWPGDFTRNYCSPVLFDYNSVWNSTGTRWFLFRTTTCNGSHAEIAPGYEGALPSGYAGGQTHAVMRTSYTS